MILNKSNLFSVCFAWLANSSLTIGEKNGLRCDSAGLSLAVKEENEWNLFTSPLLNRWFYFLLLREMLKPSLFH